MNEQEFKEFMKDMHDVAAKLEWWMAEWGHILKAEMEDLPFTPEQLEQVTQLAEHIEQVLN